MLLLSFSESAPPFPRSLRGAFPKQSVIRMLFYFVFCTRLASGFSFTFFSVLVFIGLMC